MRSQKPLCRNEIFAPCLKATPAHRACRCANRPDAATVQPVSDAEGVSNIRRRHRRGNVFAGIGGAATNSGGRRSMRIWLAAPIKQSSAAIAEMSKSYRVKERASSLATSCRAESRADARAAARGRRRQAPWQCIVKKAQAGPENRACSAAFVRAWSCRR